MALVLNKRNNATNGPLGTYSHPQSQGAYLQEDWSSLKSRQLETVDDCRPEISGVKQRFLEYFST